MCPVHACVAFNFLMSTRIVDTTTSVLLWILHDDVSCSSTAVRIPRTHTYIYMYTVSSISSKLIFLKFITHRQRVRVSGRRESFACELGDPFRRNNCFTSPFFFSSFSPPHNNYYIRVFNPGAYASSPCVYTLVEKSQRTRRVAISRKSKPNWTTGVLKRIIIIIIIARTVVYRRREKKSGACKCIRTTIKWTKRAYVHGSRRDGYYVQSVFFFPPRSVSNFMIITKRHMVAAR